MYNLAILSAKFFLLPGVWGGPSKPSNSKRWLWKGRKALFGPYKASVMATLKCHTLHHLVDSLRHVGSIEYLDTGCFWNLSQIIRKQLLKTVDKSHTAMLDTPAKWNFESFQTLVTGTSVRFRSRNFAWAQYSKREKPALGATGKITLILQLQDVQRHSASIKNVQTSFVDLPDHIVQFCSLLEEDGLSTIINLHFEDMECFCCETGLWLHKRIQMVSSVYTVLYEAPTGDCPTFGYSTFFGKSSRRKLNRIVASPFCNGMKQKRFDTVMIENDENLFLGQPEDMFPIWLVQALC